MYRSTGDIFDNFASFTGIFQSQLENLSRSAPFCFNDLDMLTVGMYNQGNVAYGRPCTDEEYRMQFSLWCLAGSPLMIGADVRKISPKMKELLQNPRLIAIDQDEECRPPYLVSKRAAIVPEENPEEAVEPLRFIKDRLYIFMKQLADHRFVLACCNFHSEEAEMLCSFAELGIPYSSGLALEMEDVFTGERIGRYRDYYRVCVKGHDCRLYLCRTVHGDA